MKKLSVIIVNYNVCLFLEQAISSARKAMKDIDGEIIVVDNNSVDGSGEMVKTKFPEVTLIENANNVGFSKANNQGIIASKGEYILLLNPDTLVEEDTFQKCIDFMDARPQAGGLGVKMLDGKGEFLPESKRGLPSPWVAFYKVFGFAKVFPKSKKFGRYHLGFLDKDQTHEIEVLSGAYMFLRQSVLEKIGGLDEEYFMYGEDIDLSYRILKAGYKNYYYSDARIIHYKGESTKRTSVNYVFIFYKAMIIFARKHFSSKNAWAFSLLINLAIYLRATVAIVNRFVKKAILPISDALLIFGGVYLIKDFWEDYAKHTKDYPSDLVKIVLPLYTLIWLVSAYVNGVYDKPVRQRRIIRGIFIGTVVISALSNFYDAYRFSKAIILFGGIYSALILLISRKAIHFLKYKNFDLASAKKKRVVIVGNAQESKRVIQLVNDGNFNLKVQGFVSPQQKVSGEKMHLGTIDQMQEIITIYEIEEVIFCSKDIPAQNIIEWMTRMDNKVLDFKIVPDDSNYIIGSNSKNKPGEFYTLNIELNIIQKTSVRNKRVFDLVMSLLLLIFSPLLIWFAGKPWRFYKNIFQVMFGNVSWVGFSNDIKVNLPKIKKGIIHPGSNKRHKEIDSSALDKLNFQYAKNYSPFMDFRLMLSSFNKLGK